MSQQRPRQRRTRELPLIVSGLEVLPVEIPVWERELIKCVFHAIAITDSRGSRSPVPRESDHRFHGKPISDSAGVDHPADC
jgi:hypothetical protein